MPGVELQLGFEPWLLLVTGIFFPTNQGGPSRTHMASLPPNKHMQWYMQGIVGVWWAEPHCGSGEPHRDGPCSGPRCCLVERHLTSEGEQAGKLLFLKKK